jgi:hypothetical protein
MVHDLEMEMKWNKDINEMELSKPILGRLSASHYFKVRGSWSKKVVFREISNLYETATSRDLKSLRKSTFLSLCWF